MNNDKMKKVQLVIAILFLIAQMNYAVGVLSSVYLNPVGGDDANNGSQLYPVRTWDKALSLAANNATVYVTWGAFPITSNMAIDGNKYGATNITVSPNTGYTGALFAISDNATGTFSNVTIKGVGTPQVLISVNSKGTLTISNDVSITDGGEISLDGGAKPINLTATPPAGMSYLLLTTYLAATDEARVIVNAGSVASPLQYFTLIEPSSNAGLDYELRMDGTDIRLYELPKGGIYLDPFGGNDAYSGAKSNRPLKTLNRAIAQWNIRNTATPGVVTDIYVLSRITLTGNLTLDNGIKLTRFAKDADRPTDMTDYLIDYTNREVTINNATIDNGDPNGVALNSDSNGKLTLNNGATITAGNKSNIINTGSNGTTIVNDGAVISRTTTNPGTNIYCISSNSNSVLTINGGTFTSTGSIIQAYGVCDIHGGVFTSSGTSECIRNNAGTMTINDCEITSGGRYNIYNYYDVTLVINGGVFRNTMADEVNNASGIIYNEQYCKLTINGGTFDGGRLPAIYNTCYGSGFLKLNGGDYRSTNTTFGTIYSTYPLSLNGQNVTIEGTIYMASTNTENYCITITSPSVTKDYTIRVADGVNYAALVISNPVIDLGPYLSRFTLVPKPGYALAAYANKGEPFHNIVLFDPNGIYVNDYTGNDSNPGTSPNLPVKTLENAAGKSSVPATSVSIYICDSTLVIKTPQTITPAAPKDTIKPFMFRKPVSNSIPMIQVIAGGALAMQNMAVTAQSVAMTRMIQVEKNGDLQLNTGVSLITYGLGGSQNSGYAIYQNGGNVVMRDGSKITSHPVLSTKYGVGIYSNGNVSTLTLENNVIIEKQSGYALSIAGGAQVNIGEAIIQNNNQPSSYYQAIYVYNGTLALNGTIIRNNSYRALSISGNAATVTMTGGTISNNGSSNGSSTFYQGAVNIEDQATFNLYGGTIEKYYLHPNSYNSVTGELVNITSGGKMNFYGGTLIVSQADRNAIFVNTSGTTATTAGHLTLSNQATLDSGYIFCSSSFFAPISLSESLNPAKKFQVNFGDNMAGCVLVDGTSPNTFPASVGNFELNPKISTLSLRQDGDNVVIGSSAIYLNGVTGNDANDGSSSLLAVKTFTRARERLQITNGNVIIIVNGATLGNTGESENWDLNFNPDAVVRRGVGYTGYLVNIPSGKSLTLSDITFDGNKKNEAGDVRAIIYSYQGTLTINSGTVIGNNNKNGVDINFGNFYMNGGEILNNNNYGIYLYATTAYSNEFIMTGGSVRKNGSSGIYGNYYKYIRLRGGEIKQNGQNGIYSYNNHVNGVMEIGGTAKITENLQSGIQNGGQTLDSLIISGGEISNNSNYGVYQYAKNVSITGGVISNNKGSYGVYVTTNDVISNSSFTMTGGTIENNKSASYALSLSSYHNCSISGGTINGNVGGGLYASGPSNDLTSVFSITGGRIFDNTNGLNIMNYSTASIENVDISNNKGYGISVTNNSIAQPGVAAIKNVTVDSNSGYGISLNQYLTSSISGNTQLTNNKNSGLYCNSSYTTSVSGDILIKGNRSTGNAGGITINQGVVSISENVTLEADTCTNSAGGIYVSNTGNVDISGNVKIKDCINTSSSNSYGGSAIMANGKLSMTGGSITGCKTERGAGTVYVSGSTSDVSLKNITIRDNTASYGGAIYVSSAGKITLDSDTITDNVSTKLSYTTPVTGAIHYAGGVNGRLSLRDNNHIVGDIFITAATDIIYVDEALLNSDVGAFRLLAPNNIANPGKIIVSPNGTTVTDASQFLTRFTLMNQNGRGLDKGGTNDEHIIIVNQFFIDGTKPANGSGSNPLTAFNNLSQSALQAALKTAYTTIWVSGPVKTTGAESLPAITQDHVNIRRYTGFAVAAQMFSSYDSVMFTIEPGGSLTIPGGNSKNNIFTISGEGGSTFADASIFKNYGTLTIGGFTNLYFNPTAGNGAAINQSGTFNLSGDVDFNLYSPNTVYLAENKVINITGQLNTTTPIGITVETAPANTHISARVLVTGSTANVPPDMINLFYNEITPNPLPIGYVVNGSTANLIFYIADRNVAGVPIYTKLQDAFDAAITTDNDEVRLYGHTPESVLIDKRLRYNSNGFAVLGSFTLDSVAKVQLLDDLLADTLYIRATTFSNKTQLDLNNHAATIANAAYLDLRLPANAVLGDWYPVNLPFDAHVADIRDASDTMRQVIHLQDFGIAAFDSQRRAQYGIGNQPSNPNNDWQYFTEETMINGKGYMVTGNNLQTLRFKAAHLNLFSTRETPASYSTGLAGVTHHGINYLAQPLSTNATIEGGIPYNSIIQVSENLSSDRIGGASYVSKRVDNALVIAPYTNYFYQTDANITVSYTPTTDAATVRSAVASANNPQLSLLTSQLSSDVPAYYELRLWDNTPDSYDALFVAASDFASTDRYETGRDVIKMGTNIQAQQIWSVGFDVALCANEVRSEEGVATIPMFINMPVAGKTYHLRLQNKVKENEQLWLCHAGRPIQNLTENPEFTMEGAGATTDEYSLRIQSGATSNKPLTTGNVHVYANNNTIIISELQINDSYSVYDMSGRLFANGIATDTQTKIHIAKGPYVVQVNGTSYKVLVN